MPEIGEGDRVRVINRYIRHYNRTGWVRSGKGGMYKVSLDGDDHTTPLWFDEIWPISTATGASLHSAPAMAGA